MPPISSKPHPIGRPDLPPIALGLAGLGAAFAVASCCALPLILSALGIGSAGLVGLALWAAPHRTFLLISGAAFLGGAAVLLWRQRPTITTCTSDGIYSRAGVRAATTVGIATGFVLLVLGYLYA
jgi:mercuric ion transport protein